MKAIILTGGQQRVKSGVPHPAALLPLPAEKALIFVNLPDQLHQVKPRANINIAALNGGSL